MPFSSEFISALDALSETNSGDKALTVLNDYITHCGFDNYNYSVVSDATVAESDPEITMYSTMEATWIDYYFDKQLAADDYLVDHLTSGRFNPILVGNNLDGLTPELSAPQQNAIDLAYEAGLHAGLGIILPSPTHYSDLASGICLSSRMSRRDFTAMFDIHREEILLLVHIVHQHMGPTLMRQKYGYERLTARERDCLLLLSNGLRPQRIAERLGLADITIHTHLRTARLKLKSKTMPQAVAMAIKLGEIVP